MGMERVDGKIQSGVKPPQSKKEESVISREDAKVRRKERRRFSVSFPSPSSAVAKDVSLICKHLRMKSGDFLHYILHPY
jgi:hypothetical protein